MSSGSTTVAQPRPARGAKPRKPRRARKATLAVGMRVGAWKVDGELGRGGMGSVYAVTHHGFGKRAALKLCHKSALTPEFTCEMFLREARVVHLVQHPGVIDVFATGSYDGRPYLAMERLAGMTLGQRMDQAPLPRRDALGVLVEVCEVLEAAHAAGVVHRDLKLDNVFLLDAAGAGNRRVKLLDWGVARIVGEPDPMIGMIAGTLTYVAPEQCRGEETTPAADVYSLGVLAYQLLLREPPFASPSDLDLIQKHLHEAPPQPSTRWPEIPPALDALLVEMLAKDPARRPTIRETLAVFRAVQSVAPAEDPPHGPLSRVARSSLVRAGIAIAAIAATVAGILGA